ncbi:MAG: LysM peptidoglycan-binding domain-containing protein [Chloroflexales bacterium]|nr:LysM peptidoglycan-binding domain-containing protein [Chloroflexales bacterium]
MPQPLVYLLLFITLVLPIPGALALRLLGPRLGERGVLAWAAALFTLAIGGALTLSRAEVPLLRVGDLTLLLPSTRGDEIVLPPELIPADGLPDGAPPEIPTLTPRPSVTPSPTTTPTASATPEPTATATPEPPTPTAEPPAGGRRYTVESGDTIRAIAESFEVSVEALMQANDLSPEEADALRVGQELIIP